MMALAVGAGLLAFAVVAYRLGSRWLDLLEGERRDEEGIVRERKKKRTKDDSSFDDVDTLVRLAREGPDRAAQADREAWIEEQRAAGRTEREIQWALAHRDPILFI